MFLSSAQTYLARRSFFCHLAFSLISVGATSSLAYSTSEPQNITSIQISDEKNDIPSTTLGVEILKAENDAETEGGHSAFADENIEELEEEESQADKLIIEIDLEEKPFNSDSGATAGSSVSTDPISQDLDEETSSSYRTSTPFNLTSPTYPQSNTFDFAIFPFNQEADLFTSPAPVSTIEFLESYDRILEDNDSGTIPSNGNIFIAGSNGAFTTTGNFSTSSSVYANGNGREGSLNISLDGNFEAANIYWKDVEINAPTRTVTAGSSTKPGEFIMEGGSAVINILRAQGTGSITLSQGAQLTVKRDEGELGNNRASSVDTHTLVIDGNGTLLRSEGKNSIKAKYVTVSNGATLSLKEGMLLYLNGSTAESTTLTLFNGGTLESQGYTVLDLFRTSASYTNITRTLAIGGEASNTIRGNWQVDISSSFCLDFSGLAANNNNAGLVIDGNLNFFGDDNNQFSIFHENFQFDQTYTLFELTDGSSLTINGRVLSGQGTYDILDYFKGLSFGDLDLFNTDEYSTYFTYENGVVTLKIVEQAVLDYLWRGNYASPDSRNNTWSQGLGGMWSKDGVYEGGASTGGDSVYFKERGNTNYVDIAGEVWSQNIDVTVSQGDRSTQDAYVKDYGYVFYSFDGTGSITDCYIDAEGNIIGENEYRNLSPTQREDYTKQATNITKNGDGTLTIYTSNSLSGNIYLNEGKLAVTITNALGTATVHMKSGTEISANYYFQSVTDPYYRNPSLSNDIHFDGGDEGKYTIAYGALSITPLMVELLGQKGMDYQANTSRHWRTLTLTGALTGSGEVTLMGYTSHVGNKYYTSMFDIHGSEAQYSETGEYISGSSFHGTIKLDNYLVHSPLAGTGAQEMDDHERGSGAVQLRISDKTLQFATIDLTRSMETLTPIGQTKEITRQTPDHILLLTKDAAVAGLNGDFLGTITKSSSPKTDDIISATQNEEADRMRVVTNSATTLTLNSADNASYVFSGVVGGEHQYASDTEGYLNQKSTNSLSLEKLGEGSQYIYSGSIHDLTIGQAPYRDDAGESGGTIGFRDLKLSGSLTMNSGSVLELGVTEAERTNANGTKTTVKWHADDFSTSADGAFTYVDGEYVLYNEAIHGGDALRYDRDDRSKVVTRTDGETFIKTANSITINKGEHVRVYTNAVDENKKPIGSTIVGNLHMGADTSLDFISSVCPTLGNKDLSVPQIVALGEKTFVKASELGAPTDGFLLKVDGRMEFNGICNVDFSGVDFNAELNNKTYFLAHFSEGIIGSFSKQIISLGQGYYGIIQSIETYTGADYFTINGQNYTMGSDFSFDSKGNLSVSESSGLTSINVKLDGNQYEGYSFDYTWTLDDVTTTETICLVLGEDGNYYYSINGLTLSTTVTGNNAVIDLSGAAYGDLDGYLVMTVTNAPPRTWFNTDNILDPKNLNLLRDENNNIVYITAENGDKYIVYVTTEGELLTLAPGDTHTITVDGKEITANNYGETGNGNIWTNKNENGTNFQDWVANHLAFEDGCRVRFDNLGVARYHGQENGISIYSRGGQVLYYDDSRGYGMWYAGIDSEGKVTGNPVLFEFNGLQYDLVYVRDHIQPLSVYVDAEAAQEIEGGVSLGKGDYINYYFIGIGSIGDVLVTEQNKILLEESGITAELGETIKTTFEKTGGGIVGIDLANTYSGGTILRAGTLELNSNTILNEDGSIKSSAIGTGEIRSYAGSTLQLNNVDHRSGAIILTALYNDLEVYYTGHETANQDYADKNGSIIRNGYYYPIDDKNTRTYINIVQLRGSISSESDDSILTLLGVRAEQDDISNVVTYWLKDLNNYTGTVRLDSELVDSNDRVIAGKKGGAILLSLSGTHAAQTTIDLCLNNSTRNTLQIQESGVIGVSLTLKSLVGGSSTHEMHGFSNVIINAENRYGTLTISGIGSSETYYGDLGYGYYYDSGKAVGHNSMASGVMKLIKQGATTQTIGSARLDGLDLQGGRLHFLTDLIISGNLKMADGTQLVIGADGLADTSTLAYSIILQGEGHLAFRNNGDSSYETADGRTITNDWTNLSFNLGQYNSDVTTNMLMTGGTLSAQSDLTLGLTIRFEVDDADTAIIDTSSYDYETSMLDEVGIVKTDNDVSPHIITFTNELGGFGDIGIRGGGSVVFKAANTFVAGNDLDRTSLYVSGNTSLDLEHENAVGTFINGSWTYSANINMGQYITGDRVSTLAGRTRITNGILAQMASVEISHLSDLQLLDSYKSTVTNVTAMYDSIATLKNIRAGHVDGVARIEGLHDDTSKNTMDNAHVTMAEKTTQSMKNLTISASQIDILKDAKVTMEDIFMDSKTIIRGVASATIRTSASSFGSLHIQSLQIQALTGDNVTLKLDAAPYYSYGTEGITYSESATREKHLQQVYTLANIASTELNGVDGGLVLKFENDFIALEQIDGKNWYLGLFFELATEGEELSERLVTLEFEDGTSVESSFYTVCDDGTGVTFYFLIPEPSSTTLFLISIAASCLRRRRQI